MEETTRTQKVKDHFKKHKVAYIAGAAGVAVGVAGTLVVCSGNSGNVAVQKVIAFKTGNVTQHVTQEVIRRGHPGYRIQCNETGESFASIRRTAEVLGLNRSHIQEHLKGVRESVNGFTFQNLGEATRVA